MADTRLLYPSPSYRAYRQRDQSYNNSIRDPLGAHQNKIYQAEAAPVSTQRKRELATEIILRGREMMREVYAEEETERRLVAEYGPRRT